MVTKAAAKKVNNLSDMGISWSLSSHSYHRKPLANFEKFTTSIWGPYIRGSAAAGAIIISNNVYPMIIIY